MEPDKTSKVEEEEEEEGGMEPDKTNKVEEEEEEEGGMEPDKTSKVKEEEEEEGVMEPDKTSKVKEEEEEEGGMEPDKTSKARANFRMMQSKFICCKLYISESCNSMALDAIDRAASIDPQVVVITKFEDCIYNRVRYTLVSYIVNDCSTGEVKYSPIRKVLLRMMEAAFSTIDLESRTGSHPSMGVNDDLSFHPFGEATMEDAACLAKLVASDIGNNLQVPVFLYAAAHPTAKSVGAIRRELGYYRPNYKENQWAGTMLPDVLPLKPDVGPTNVSPKKGAITVGATPFLEGYNVPILSTDIATVRRITRRIIGQRGGLPTVLAMALLHGDDCTEIACLFDPDHVRAFHVQTVVEQIAAEQGLEVKKGYLTDVTKDRILDKYFEARLCS